MAAHKNPMMSAFVDHKMKAMEEEMSRFEQEISGGPGDTGIPAGYVPPAQPPPIPGMSPMGLLPAPAATVRVPGTATLSIPMLDASRPSVTATIRGFVPKPQMLTSVRPEVGPQLPSNLPPSQRPAFVPHQVQAHRGAPPHMGGRFHPPHPGMMPPGPRGPMGMMPMGPRGPMPMGPRGPMPIGPRGPMPIGPRGPMPIGPRGPMPIGPRGPMPMMPGPMLRPPHGMMGQMRPPMVHTPAVISASPTIYSARPVRFVSKKKVDTKEETDKTTSVAGSVTTTNISQAPPGSTIMEQPMPTPTLPIVQVNPAIMSPYTMNPVHAMPPADAIVDPTQQPTTSSGEGKKKDKKKKFVRIAANMTWEDESLSDWDPNDFRIFCGDLGNEVTDELLAKVFCKFPSFIKAKVVRDKRTNKTKGFGFVSFKDPGDFANAMRELNGKYVGNRPIKLRKSNWRDRNLDTFRKKQREKQRLGLR